MVYTVKISVKLIIISGMESLQSAIRWLIFGRRYGFMDGKGLDSSMELSQHTFASILEQLRETARLQGNILTSEQIREAYANWQLGEGQLALIHDYFRKHSIGIDAPLESEEDFEEQLSREDVNFLEMYLADLKELAFVSDGEKRAVTMSALAKDKIAQEKLIEIYLPQVVEISKLYAGQGVLVEDLIGEGNVAVAAAVTMLDCVESIDEVDSFIAKMIMDAMEQHIAENTDNQQLDEAVLNKVNDVNDKAKELYDNLLRKVTIKEVAEELDIDEEEVREVIKLSANSISYIEDYADGRI